MQLKLDELGIAIPEILLPNDEVDPSKWAVVACDQHTSNPEYWSQVEQLVGNSPSMLHLVFPEALRKSIDLEDRLRSIREHSRRYNSLLTPRKGFTLVDRQTPNVESRKGLVVAHRPDSRERWKM